MLTDLPDHERWNHSIAYQRELSELIPETARTALDVGCGEGLLARELVKRGLAVTALDTDAASIERARAQLSDGIDYRIADVMTEHLREHGFDVVTCVATLHHLDLDSGLRRLSELTAPGGTVLIVGLAQATWRELHWEAVAIAADVAARRRRQQWEHPSPTIWPPPHTYAQVREAATRIMPGSVYRRRALWRYTLTWTKPLDR
ncbi:class I SAM-dependent methyltransferase [Demequina activiva]|uniref:Methyltransferase type 11 domain-containing protein n=1 Tax=Demequina activiva TaxID=1582364 RepID=A0A919UFW7_9MICO|nr:class I SAM-dependent methyltransferase [Demequina activiva]GIG54192.1 hypothetical protein Dac01nite_09440 [Demequina activiva]